MAASKTAQYVALYRALETGELRRAPLFHDPFAVRFLSRGLRIAARAAELPFVRPLLERYADARAPGARTSAIARTAFLDDAVRAAMRAGTRQLVLLGAGFDCRAHRLDELADAAVFEVDRADTQARKRALAPSSAVHYVAVDFLRDELGAALAGAGWDAAARTFIVWEGVTNYLTEGAVRSVLAWIGRACAPGSAVAFTYIHAGVLRGDAAFDGGAQLRKNVARLGEPWTFGIDPAELPAFVASCGLALREDIGADDYRRRYLGQIAPGYGFYRIAVADVAA